MSAPIISAKPRRNYCYSALMNMVYDIDVLSCFCNFSLLGMEHKMHFTYCLCETLAKTMCRAKLWPATPTNPQYAFSFALLDWVEALLLECQVSVKDFCNALTFRVPFHTEMVHNVLSVKLFNYLSFYRNEIFTLL